MLYQEERSKRQSKDVVALLLTLFGADQRNNQKENLYGTASQANTYGIFASKWLWKTRII